ncbi:hypothetical protein GCM10017691_41640 [Pseudonocardia petroleophila]
MHPRLADQPGGQPARLGRAAEDEHGAVHGPILAAPAGGRSGGGAASAARGVLAAVAWG